MRGSPRSGYLSVMVLLLMVLPRMVLGGDFERSRETLRGIKRIHVLVESLEPEIEKAGLTQSLIKTDVELKLRLAGLNILKDEEFKKTPKRAYLYVNANILITSSGFYVYNIDLELTQAVNLVGDSQGVFPGTTWSTEALGINSDLKNIRSAIKDRVDVFLSGYLSVNPK